MAAAVFVVDAEQTVEGTKSDLVEKQALVDSAFERQIGAEKKLRRSIGLVRCIFFFCFFWFFKFNFNSNRRETLGSNANLLTK